MSACGFLVPAKRGPLAFLAPGDLRVLDAQQCAADAMAEADNGIRHAGRDTLNAGQAAVDAVNKLRGRR
jgi:hypothetical protein